MVDRATTRESKARIRWRAVNLTRDPIGQMQTLYETLNLGGFDAVRPKLEEYNRLNRRVFERVHADALAGRGVVISMTDCYRTTDYGEPIAALKS